MVEAMGRKGSKAREEVIKVISFKFENPEIKLIFHLRTLNKIATVQKGGIAFGEPRDIVETDIGRLNKFMIGLKRLVDL